MAIRRRETFTYLSLPKIQLFFFNQGIYSNSLIKNHMDKYYNKYSPIGKEKVRNKILESNYTNVHGNLMNFGYVLCFVSFFFFFSFL